MEAEIELFLQQHHDRLFTRRRESLALSDSISSDKKIPDRRLRFRKSLRAIGEPKIGISHVAKFPEADPVTTAWQKVGSIFFKPVYPNQSKYWRLIFVCSAGKPNVVCDQIFRRKDRQAFMRDR